MDGLRLLTALVAVTCIACWTESFNWHFLPNHYRLYSNLTAVHTVQFDTNCGTLAADSGATHVLWDPESGLCSVSSGLTAAEFSVSIQQDSKTSFYYVRDFALVVPPGSPNCPTEAQLKRMIDNLLALNRSFTVEADSTRRTWRDICKKTENADATDAPATALAASPTSNATRTTNVSSITTPVIYADTTLPRTLPNVVGIGSAKTDSLATAPPSPIRSEKPLGVTDTVSSTAVVSTSWPTTKSQSPVSNANTRSPFESVSSSETTTSGVTDTTMEAEFVTSMPSTTPSDMTAPGSSTPSTETSRSATDNQSPVSNPTTQSPVTSKTMHHFATTGTSMDEDSIISTSATSTISARLTSLSAISDTTVDETMSMSLTSKTHANTVPPSSPAVPFSQDATTAWETTTESGPLTSSQGTTIPVITVLTTSTSGGPTQESTTTSSDTMSTNTTTSAMPPSSTNVTTTVNVATTGPNGGTKRLAFTASSIVKECKMPRGARYAPLLLDMKYPSRQPQFAGHCACENGFTKVFLKPTKAADKVELTCGDATKNINLFVCATNGKCRDFGKPAPHRLRLSTVCNGAGCTITVNPIAQTGLSQFFYKPIKNVTSISCRDGTYKNKKSQCFGPFKAG